MLLFIIITGLLLASFGCLAMASLMLLLKDANLNRVSTCLLYIASGILLGAALGGMIPKAIMLSDPFTVLSLVLLGIVLLFILEKVVLWRNCGNQDCERHTQASTPVTLAGDALHHIIDGVVITSSFLVSLEVGIMVCFSIALHEIPKSLGDLSILIKNGQTRKQAFWNKAATVSTAPIFGVLAYYLSHALMTIIPYVLALSAASFLYLALAQLIPSMHRKTSLKDSILQIVFFILGIGIIYSSFYFN